MTPTKTKVCARARRRAICRESHRAPSHSCATCKCPPAYLPVAPLFGMNDRIASVVDPTDDVRSLIAPSGRQLDVKTASGMRVPTKLALTTWLRSSALIGALMMCALPTFALASETAASFQVGLRILPAKPHVSTAAAAPRAPAAKLVTAQPMQPPPLPTVTMRWLRADETGNAPARSIATDARQSGSQVRLSAQAAPLAD